jgi:REP element-mobilizing transposase RayT
MAAFLTEMSHTYSNLIYHVVFSTKERVPLITKQTRPELYAYLGALVKELKGAPLIINGIDDHVHLLISLPPTVSPSDAMRLIKSNSSRWMSERMGIDFSWQKGFGIFSVSRSGVNAVVEYIRDQELHHAKRDFRSEFITMLDKNGVEFEEKYLWA